MKDELEGLLSFIIFFIVIVLIIVGITFGIGIISEKNYCATMQEINSDFDFKWVLHGGCLVETPSGYWISAHKYIYIEGDVR